MGDDRMRETLRAHMSEDELAAFERDLDAARRAHENQVRWPIEDWDWDFGDDIDFGMAT